MNQKYIGSFLILIGILILVLTSNSKTRDDANIDLLIEAQNGSCYLDDGTCLHQDRDYTPYIIGLVISFSIIILGIYLIFFDRTHELFSKNQERFSKELSESKKAKEFEAFLSGFDEEKRRMLKIIHEQEGIKQSTLRFRAGMSKTGLSLALKDLEEKNIISRRKSGKTYEVFLIRKY